MHPSHLSPGFEFHHPYYEIANRGVQSDVVSQTFHDSPNDIASLIYESLPYHYTIEVWD